MKRNLQILLSLVVVVFLATSSSVYGQTTEATPALPSPHQNPFVADPIRQLNLTPEQREQIRTIREQNRDERSAINARLRQTNRALEDALDSDNPDQVMVEQRMREVSAAQADAMRMRILTEVKIRQVLTPEQRTILRTLRHRAHDVRRERRIQTTEDRLKRREERSLRFKERRNNVRPLFRGPAPQDRPRP
jgi:Spy/CpxP family protein refolding chaperone